MSLTYGRSPGVDVDFHLAITENYARGNFAGAVDYMYVVNKSFYPPLFHLLLLPSVLLGMGLPFSGLLSALFLPLGVACFEFLALKTLGERSAFIGGFLVLGSWSFTDRLLQAIPQGVDFVLLPLAFYFGYFAVNDLKSEKRFLVASVLAIWNHGVICLSTLGGLLLTKFKQKQYRAVLGVAVFSAPIIFVSLCSLPIALTASSGLSNFTNYMWATPAIFWVLTVRLLTFGFPIMFYRIYQYTKGKPLSKVSKFSIITIVVGAVMLPFWADRWVQYCSIPLALLMLEAFQDLLGARKAIWFSAVAFAFLYMYFGLWLLLLFS